MNRDLHHVLFSVVQYALVESTAMPSGPILAGGKCHG